MTKSIDEFVKTIAKLRAPDGCPWDREQTHKTLGRYLIEESYEVLEAIHQDDPKKLKEELGDLLLQIVLNSQIATENDQFDFYDVANGINEKMISRHPHVFGKNKLDNPEQVVQQWEELKDQEIDKKQDKRKGVERVSQALPGLLQALKVSEKAVSQGFEWKEENDVWDKLVSELNELQDAISEAKVNKVEDPQKLHEEIELELGDVLFCLVNVARWQKVNPEEALIKAIAKFKKRFVKMEDLSKEPLEDLSKDDLLNLWNQAKSLLESKN